MTTLMNLLRASFNQSAGALKLMIVAGVDGTYTSTVSTITTAGAATLTTAQMLGGIILRDPAGAGRTDTTPTAAQLVAAIPGVKNGTTFRLMYRNTADAAETITIAGGTGVTISGTATIAQNNSKSFLVRIDEVTSGSEAVTVYSSGTSVF
jgi:hypothetical protein